MIYLLPSDSNFHHLSRSAVRSPPQPQAAKG
jgi:hypothetical protein